MKNFFLIGLILLISFDGYSEKSSHKNKPAKVVVKSTKPVKPKPAKPKSAKIEKPKTVKPKPAKPLASKKPAKIQRVFGIDLSEYQDNDISWREIKKSKLNVRFIILRATMGDDRKDDRFVHRMNELRKEGFIVGAYHYYDPNESSTKQAQNYLSRVKLRKGDFVPIVDLERLSSIQSTKKLKDGLRNWLNIVGKAYGVKPMIYTGYSYYLSYLAKDFADYPLWVAAYSNHRKRTEVVKTSEILQFTDKLSVRGVRGKVDGNDIQKENLPKILLKK